MIVWNRLYGDKLFGIVLNLVFIDNEIDKVFVLNYLLWM